MRQKGNFQAMKSEVSLYPENLVDLDNIEAVPVAFRTGYAATFDTTLSTCTATVVDGNPHNGVFSYARYPMVPPPISWYMMPITSSLKQTAVVL